MDGLCLRLRHIGALGVLDVHRLRVGSAAVPSIYFAYVLAY
jgi:hypothetical protein